jgi:uncharacterized oxidoreductase
MSLCVYSSGTPVRQALKETAVNMSGNTILVTGGSSGIGLELAGRLLELGNVVIVTGRDAGKLAGAQRLLPQLHTIQSDAADPDAIVRLHQTVTRQFPALNVLVNNAGCMRKINLHAADHDIYDITREIDVNLVAPIRMVRQFLPHLKRQPSAAIVNVSSGLAFVPLAISPVYSATKAAVHSFTQSLRMQLKSTNVKVFELAPPAADTALFHGDFTEADVQGVTPMAVATLADHAIAGLRKDVYEIRPGLANALRLMSRVAPQLILRQLSRSVDSMLSEPQSHA